MISNKNLILLIIGIGMCIQIVNSQEKQIYDFTAIDEKIQSWVYKKYYPGASKTTRLYVRNILAALNQILLSI